MALASQMSKCPSKIDICAIILPYFAVIASCSHFLNCWNSTLQMEGQERRLSKDLLFCVHVVVKLRNFDVGILQTTAKKCAKVRAVRTARFFFLVQPIRFTFLCFTFRKCVNVRPPTRTNTYLRHLHALNYISFSFSEKRHVD